MALDSASLHIYNRDIDPGQRTSLSVLVSHIGPGARVLDLGCGSGAVGRFLTQRDGADAGPIDGLTLSTHEAELAAPDYRKVEVADLDRCELTQLFTSGSYDYVICADVLEHTRHPDRILAQCRTLLAPGGHALLSLPNAGYAGLIAELMTGEFRYRKEGLLDETHLRFFTRRSLMRFLADGHWAMDQVDTIERSLSDSEFNVAFDALPPAVSRHLLGLPDALSYQFIVVARPAAPDEEIIVPKADVQLPARALFTAELYLATDGRFDEQQKITATGVIGDPQQSIFFALPNTAPDRLKLDPADRPGFLYLHSLRLYDAEDVLLWHWTPDQADLLLGSPRNGLEPQPGWWPGSPFMVLLHGNDPWIELPIPSEALAQASNGRFQAEVGWPMSADYLALASLAHTRISEAGHNARLAQQQAAQAAVQAERLGHQNEHLRQQKNILLEQAHTLNQERDEALQRVHNIESTLVYRATRPIARVKRPIDDLLNRRRIQASPPPRPAAQAMTPSNQPVAIIVPVYKGLQDTRRCLESVLAATGTTPWHLVVINDASPEPELTDWLRSLAADDERITLLENEDNLGFVGTVNRGMALSPERDVLLLNSDTEVADDWLDRLRSAAYSDQKVASVTPFSNNATICSYPRFCQDNELPEGWSTARLDALFARVNAGQVVDVPTGVGFCMYIRRDALDAVGLFDEAQFGKGYGEENDFCIRAAQAGWRNLHALDTFVRHFGGVSFGASKNARELAAMETLRRLHPRYEADILRFVQADPAQLARTQVDVARIVDGQRPVILAVLHDRSGGTERHVHELASLLREQAQFLVLRPKPGQQLSLSLPDPDEGFELVFRLPQDEATLLAVLRQLGVCHVHYHHLLGHGKLVRGLARRLGVSHDFTAHDFFPICPQISLTDPTGGYCGRRSPALCNACLSRAPAADGTRDINQWRQRSAEWLNDARFVIAPGRDVLARFISHVPAAPLRLVPHTDIAIDQALPAPRPEPLEGDRPLKVAVIGALSVIKGADTLEDAALQARKCGAPVEFHLLGYGYRNLKAQPHASLAIYGPYDELDLPDLLDWLQPDLVWFPARWPETYSYTLSACLLGGWPVVAPDLGAFAERLDGRDWSWICPWDWTPAQWLDFFTDIRTRHFATGQGPGPLAPVPLFDSSEVTRAFSPQPSSWYASDYLSGLPGLDSSSPATDVLAKHLPEPADGLVAGVKGLALGTLTRLRNLPLLAPVARAIPTHWQSRVKSWLRG